MQAVVRRNCDCRQLQRPTMALQVRQRKLSRELTDF